MHPDSGIARNAPLEFLEHCYGVERRLGIGHTEDSGKPTGRCRLCPRPDRFLPLLAGFAQVHMDVNPTRCHDQTIDIKDCFAGLRP
jgi:hypothetical protein